MVLHDILHVLLLYIKDIFRVENNLYSPCSNLEGIEMH